MYGLIRHRSTKGNVPPGQRGVETLRTLQFRTPPFTFLSSSLEQKSPSSRLAADCLKRHFALHRPTIEEENVAHVADKSQFQTRRVALRDRSG
jgi:hypothetical protein